MSRRHRPALGAACVIAAALVPAGPLSAAAYTLLDLGPLGESYVASNGFGTVNNSGQVVGYSYTPTAGDIHAFRTVPNGGRGAVKQVRGEFEQRTWDTFWRTVIEGISPTAVAEEMHTTPAAVRQAKSRVLRRLKQEMGEVLE